jgi:hypothetical protein
LIVGNRNSFRSRLPIYRTEGVLDLVRLPPRAEVKLPAIIEDVEDAFRWLHDKVQPCSAPMKRHVAAVRREATNAHVRIHPAQPKRSWPTGVMATWMATGTKPSEHYQKLGLIDKKEVSDAIRRIVRKRCQQQQTPGPYYTICARTACGRRSHQLRSEKTGLSSIRATQSQRHCRLSPTILIHGTEDATFHSSYPSI